MAQLSGGDEAVVVTVEDLVPLSAPSQSSSGRVHHRAPRTLKASRISSSESVSFILRAIMVRNSAVACRVSTRPRPLAAHAGA